jgi:hypothetical protein
MVRLRGQKGPTHVRLGGRRGVHGRAVELHEMPALDFPIVHGSDPIDGRPEAREARRVREGGPPLPRPRLRRETLVTLVLRVPRLGEGGVHLVTPRRAVEFRLVVEMGGRPEPLLEPTGADQRPGPARLQVQVLDLRRDVDPTLGRGLLPKAFANEEFRQGLEPRRSGVRVLRRRHGLG